MFFEVPHQRIFWSHCSAVTSSASPLVQWDHVSGSCHGFPNAGVEGQLPVPLDIFPRERLDHQMRGICLHTVVSTVFNRISHFHLLLRSFGVQVLFFFPFAKIS